MSVYYCQAGAEKCQAYAYDKSLNDKAQGIAYETEHSVFGECCQKCVADFTRSGEELFVYYAHFGHNPPHCDEADDEYDLIPDFCF